MTHIERQFAIDLLRALDISLGEETRTDEDYDNDLNTVTKKEIMRAVRHLMKIGYKLDKS